MRIVGGDWRGRALARVGQGAPSDRLRPTPDRVRESLFNQLAHGGFGDPVADAVVLDLFAGTGALGLEALSRGAARATFVETGRPARVLLEENIRLTGAGPRAQILPRDATRLPANTGEAAGLVFLDPPYGRGLGGRALASARAGGWIAPGALVVWEEAEAQAPPEGFSVVDTRGYGTMTLTFLRAAGAGEDQPQVG